MRISGQQRESAMMIKEQERHYSDRIGWMRAAVLGANDGIVSTARLLPPYPG
jgi:VIT1/CCC1 family predicted Fe2+/Mn2+ transporter